MPQSAPTGPVDISEAPETLARWVELVGRYSKLPPLPKLDINTSVKRSDRTVRRVHDIHRRLGPDVITQLITDYEAGQPTTELMTTYGLGKGTVLRLHRKHGVEIRHQSLTPEQLQEAIQLYQQGWSLAKVGHHFGRDASFIHVTFKREGIPRRDPQGRPR